MPDRTCCVEFVSDPMMLEVECNTLGVSHLLGSGFELKHDRSKDSQEL